MLEVIFAVAIVALAAGGLGLGLIFGRGPALTTCSAAANRPEGRCADCPLRHRSGEEMSS